MFGDDISQVAAQAREFERSGQKEKFLQDQANDSYNDGEDRQLFPVEIDPAMDRYLRQKGRCGRLTLSGAGNAGRCWPPI